MSKKCVHKGCGKTFDDDNEDCIYHPGPPEFHEGQKGWKCCKPRFLTFDEFLEIPPCTTGKHSTVDDTPAPESKKDATSEDDPLPAPKPVANGGLEAPQPTPRLPQAAPVPPRSPAPPVAPESDSDEPDAPIPDNATCKRRGCEVTSSEVNSSKEGQSCVYHPGIALFHEGSKGWTCCKKRVLEFDEFMKIPGCKTRDRHCFVGKKKGKRKENGESELEKLATVRHDFYQTGSTVHASLYLKKIDKSKSKVEFRENGEEVDLDLKTQDGKEYVTVMPLYGRIDPQKSSFRIAGTKMDLNLAKADGLGWPVLRSDERNTGEIIQTGRAGHA